MVIVRSFSEVVNSAPVSSLRIFFQASYRMDGIFAYHMSWWSFLATFGDIKV